jgi:GTP-binding protein LepA
LLVVDAAQGIEAQTLSNVYMAIENDLDIIPVINKIDLPAADVEKVSEEIINLIGCTKEEIIPISAKTGQNVEAVLEAVIEKIDSPRVYSKKNPENDELKALVFDSQYDSYR